MYLQDIIISKMSSVCMFVCGLQLRAFHRFAVCARCTKIQANIHKWRNMPLELEKWQALRMKHRNDVCVEISRLLINAVVMEFYLFHIVVL